MKNTKHTISNSQKRVILAVTVLFFLFSNSLKARLPNSFSATPYDMISAADSGRSVSKPFPDYLFPKKQLIKNPFAKHIFPERTFIGETGFSFGRTSYMDKESGKVRRETRFAGLFHLSIHLFEEVYVRGTVFKQFQDKNLPPWTSDFYYVIERFNWRPKTFSYGYENYTPNKYNASWKYTHQHMLQGNFFVAYGHNLPEKFLNSIKIDNSTNWSVKYLIKYALNYQDGLQNNYGEGKFFSGKLTLSFFTRYTIAKKLYTEAAVYFYPERSKLVPWDPDFTYGFGYFDWRAFKVNFSYGNWVVNRFPWNEKEIKYYGFLDGDFKLTFSYAW